MTLFELFNNTEMDLDVYDTDYDACVTICYTNKEIDNSDKFCNGLIKKVEVVDATKISDNLVIADWSKLITSNLDKFKAFAKEHWYRCFEDDEDEFIYQWICEIHKYIAGYVPEEFYDYLVAFVDTLE